MNPGFYSIGMVLKAAMLEGDITHDKVRAAFIATLLADEENQ